MNNKFGRGRGGELVRGKEFNEVIEQLSNGTAVEDPYLSQISTNSTRLGNLRNPFARN